ncbi:MAG: rod shape-determining protein MreD [Chloroflexia bacterium]|nr:rod shape-determining protein MreD [Chloroflexia bacterium]
MFALLLVLAAVAQATLLPVIVPVAVVPNLVLVLVLVRTARRGVVDGLLWIVLAGLVLDTLALDPLGTNGLALVPVVLVGGLGQRRWFITGPAFPMLLAISATFASALTLVAVRAFAGEGMAPLAAVLRITALQSLLNALLVPPLYGLVGWLARAEPERAP